MYKIKFKSRTLRMLQKVTKLLTATEKNPEQHGVQDDA